MEQILTFQSYQKQAEATDICNKSSAPSDLIIPLLGISGECGSLLSEYKKHLRDGSSFSKFISETEEELGDILWYTSTIASRLNLSLEDISRKNLDKCKSRWSNDSSQYALYDTYSIQTEKLPREFRVDFKTTANGELTIHHMGKPIGDKLTDNSYRDDGYRFHDAFHLAYAAILGWSPVCRKLFDCKRKTESTPQKNIDMVEDGGRASVIEEGIAAMVFSNSQDNDHFQNNQYIPYEILKTIKTMTSHLEVSSRSFADWERAILQGFSVWRQLKINSGGTVEGNLNDRTLYYTFDI